MCCVVAVVGEKERDHQTVNVRTRDNKVHGEFSIDDVIERFQHLSATRSAAAEERFSLEDDAAIQREQQQQ